MLKMNSLNTYMSDAESDESEKQYESTFTKEVDANCEPITMDMSEESDRSYNGSSKRNSRKTKTRSRSSISSNSYSSVDFAEKEKSQSSKKKYRESSYSSDDSDDQIKDKAIRNRSNSHDRGKQKNDHKERRDKKDEKTQRKYSRDKSRSNENDDKRHSGKYDDVRNKNRRTDRYEREQGEGHHDHGRERDHKQELGDNDRNRGRERDRDRHRDHYNKSDRKYSRRSRSRSSSYQRSRRSRTRSRTPRHKYSRSRYSDRRSSYGRRSPYRSNRSRSRGPYSRYERKSKNKLQVLEKLGIELKIPPGTEALTVSTNSVTTSGCAFAAATAAAAAASIAIGAASGVNVIPPVSVGTTVTTGAPATNNSNILPLNSNSGTANSVQLTPQMLLQKQMEEQVEKVKSATGIALPSYYNPIAVNPTKYAEQIQKRRLLWGNKEKQNPPESSSDNTDTTPTPDNTGPTTIWKGATFGDQDGKMTAKFKRLMGIKGAEQEKPVAVENTGSDLIKKQEEMFNSMESQYEVARLATHSHRGLGLGFGTFQPR